MVHSLNAGQVSINISKPGIIKGQHWHNTKFEQFIVVKGHGLIQQRNLNDPEGKIKVVIDKAVADAEWFACNPGANTTHIRFKTKQLLNNFLPAERHKAEIIML